MFMKYKKYFLAAAAVISITLALKKCTMLFLQIFMFLHTQPQDVESIRIIGSADGPFSVFVSAPYAMPIVFLTIEPLSLIFIAAVLLCVIFFDRPKRS